MGLWSVAMVEVWWRGGEGEVGEVSGGKCRGEEG